MKHKMTTFYYLQFSTENYHVVIQCGSNITDIRRSFFVAYPINVKNTLINTCSRDLSFQRTQMKIYYLQYILNVDRGQFIRLLATGKRNYF